MRKRKLNDSRVRDWIVEGRLGAYGGGGVRNRGIIKGGGGGQLSEGIICRRILKEREGWKVQ